MEKITLLPDTKVEELAVCGKLSQRALKVLQRANLTTVKEVALYHADDARYLTLGGCGIKTRRELNQLIKGAYGTLQVQNFERAVPATCPAAKHQALSWQEQWLADEDEEEDIEAIPLIGVAAELESSGKFSIHDRRYYVKCRDYAAFIRERKGIPGMVADIELHRWFLAQSQSSLSQRRAALFGELCDELGV